MPYRLRYLNIVPIGGTVFRGLGGVALLKEVHQWDQVLRLDSLTLLALYSLCSADGWHCD